MFENLGPALAVLRELRGFTQAEVAKKAGIGKSQVSRYEGGREYPKLESLEKILIVLGVSPAGLLNVVSVLDGWAAAGLRVEGQGNAMLSPLPAWPACGVPAMDQAFQATFGDLLLLHRATLEEVLRASTMGRRTHRISGPDFGLVSTRD